MDLEYPVRLPLTWPKQYDKLILARIQHQINANANAIADLYAHETKPNTYKASQARWI